MSRQSEDSTVVGSSIALLQERFEKLQRMRERRKEQQLTKVSSEHEYSYMYFGHEKMDMQTQMSLSSTSRPVLENCPLSLGYNVKSNPSEFPAVEFAKATGRFECFESPDHVDTSLHL